MAILIEGMEMPTTYPLTVTIYPDGQVLSETVGAKDIHGEAVPVPPHGRLIDADAVSLEDGPYEYDEWCKWAFEQYLNAPTIIPASNATREVNAKSAGSNG